MTSEVVELTGHIIDSLLLAKVLDLIVDSGADYRLVHLEIGKTSVDLSRASIEVVADDATLPTLLDALQVHGARRVALV